VLKRWQISILQANHVRQFDSLADRKSSNQNLPLASKAVHRLTRAVKRGVSAFNQPPSTDDHDSG
jgi:hypothetical protein